MKQLLAFHPRPPDSVVSLFPTVSGGGVAFSQQEVLRQSEIYSRIYHLLIRLLATRQSMLQAIPGRACEAIARAAIVPLTHFYFDRALRLAQMAQVEPEIEVVSGSDFAPPASLEDFYVAAGTSGSLNQGILAYLAPCLSLRVADEPGTEQAGAPVANPPGYVNYLFHFGGRGLPKRLAGRARQYWSAAFGRIGAASMVNVRVPLLDSAVYGRKLLAHVDYPQPFDPGTKDPDMRCKLLREALAPAATELRRLVTELGWPAPISPDAVVRKFPDFLATFLPAALLEAAPFNLPRACRIFERFRGRAVISGGMGFSTHTAFLAAACRVLDIPLIGMQHGGHYGYSDQHVSVYECEYALCDGFITWGWEQMPSLPGGRAPRAHPLPAPWLSERVAYWERLLPSHNRFAGDRAFDILLMPNKVSMFPPAPSGSHATVNHLPEFAKTLAGLLERAGSRGLKVLHKPYNRATRELLLESVRHFPNHQFASENEKGLTAALLGRCHVVVWDQPGTGLLECLTAGIPNLVLWTRLFNSEPVWAKEDFAALERVGIVHRDPDSLLNEVIAFKKDAAGWMGSPERRAVIDRFCHRYARTARDWAQQWKRFIATLPAERKGSA